MFHRRIQLILFAGNTTSDLIVSNKYPKFTIAYFQHESVLNNFFTTRQQQEIPVRHFSKQPNLVWFLIDAVDEQFPHSLLFTLVRTNIHNSHTVIHKQTITYWPRTTDLSGARRTDEHFLNLETNYSRKYPEMMQLHHVVNLSVS